MPLHLFSEELGKCNLEKLFLKVAAEVLEQTPNCVCINP